MLRRTFLFGTAAATAACAQDRNKTAPLGSLVYVDKDTLRLRDLPDGALRTLTTGRRIVRPRFSPSGRWISFEDGDRVHVVSTTGGGGKEWKGASGDWIPGRDELAVNPTQVNVANGRDDQSWVFGAADNWSAPLRSMACCDLTIDEAGNRYARTSSTPNGRYSDGVQKFKTSLLLGGFRGSDVPRRLDETEGFFDIAGFTRNGDWLVYWRSAEMSASIQADGLALYAVGTRGGQPWKPGVVTLVRPDMVSISPAGDSIAVTAGGGRETWSGKSIAIIDLAHMRTTYLTEPSVSAQLPAWSPDGGTLAWSAGPDADALHKQQLLARGRKTIRVMDTAGAAREVPITPGLRMGAPEELVDQCVRSRRIWAGEIGPGIPARQLTNDARYFDEEPRWSHDDSRILFCRIDRQNERTIWMMRSDGSEAQQVSGPMAPPADLTDIEKLSWRGYYGYTDWGRLFDWWQGP